MIYEEKVVCLNKVDIVGLGGIQLYTVVLSSCWIIDTMPDEKHQIHIRKPFGPKKVNGV